MGDEGMRQVAAEHNRDALSPFLKLVPLLLIAVVAMPLLLS